MNEVTTNAWGRLPFADDRVDAHPQCVGQIQRHIATLAPPGLEKIEETQHRS
jgi:hypothetical protein